MADVPDAVPDGGSLAAEVARLYHDEGMSTRAVAGATGRSQSTIIRLLAGTTRRTGPKPRTDVPDALIEDLLRQRRTWDQIAAEVGMTRTGVRNRAGDILAARLAHPADRAGLLDPAVPRDGFDPDSYRDRLGDLPAWLLRGTAVDVDDAHLMWTGKTDKDGCGIRSGRKVHRVAYRLLVWPDLPDSVSLVRAGGCALMSCWAPWHLEEVGRAEADQRRRERSTSPRCAVEEFSTVLGCAVERGGQRLRGSRGQPGNGR